ncbi:MAG: hypothetical protein NVSMB1_01560 [Polyangiales bacterium]
MHTKTPPAHEQLLQQSDFERVQVEPLEQGVPGVLQGGLQTGGESALPESGGAQVGAAQLHPVAVHVQCTTQPAGP